MNEELPVLFLLNGLVCRWLSNAEEMAGFVERAGDGDLLEKCFVARPIFLLVLLMRLGQICDDVEQRGSG